MSEKTNPDNQEPALVQGRDFYLEKGYCVFTEYYLLQRGKCCGSGCRHCPYRKRKEKNAH
ncbi:MAG: hypothetical protein H6574_05250 [Lewinellaceae bacterium]|nr:hypothetical protein [Lewinellaceae bacterium]MCB9330469.1 hypothetical protein [Lewinellaceae bacterium]